MQINLNQPLISVFQKLLFSSFLIFSSIYGSWFDFSKYLYAGRVIFYFYSDQNSDKISVHSIEDYKWFFTFSEQQKIKINFQRPLVLSLCIKPLRDNAMVDKKGKIRLIYRPLPFCCKRIKHKKIKLIIVIFQTLGKLLLFSHIVGSSRVVTWNLTRAEVYSFLKQCCEPSITDGVHRNENFVEIIPVFSTFSNFFKKKNKKIIKAILCNFSMRLLKYF